ncbi:MAG: response regulator [Methanosarcinaceae archaeon]|nr:response regulator [Methanosarcinaceae archaeon]
MNMLENRKILIVDDEKGIQKIFSRILSPPLKTDVLSRGAALFGETDEKPVSTTPDHFDLVFADSGEDAIKAVENAITKKQPFSLVFMDIGLPGIDGVETVRHIWKADPDMKIIFVTGSMHFERKNICIATGREDFFYIGKPFNIKEISELAHTLGEQWLNERKQERTRLYERQ